MDDKKQKLKKEDLPAGKADSKIEELEKRMLDLENQLKRAVADYRNLEKRIAEEKGEIIRFANKDLLLKLLPAFDSLFLAEKHVADEGLKLSIDKLRNVLQEAGVEQIKTAGEVFNPAFMECVSATDGEENKVITETRPGFTLFGKVLRPSQVTVGKKIDNQEKKTEELAKDVIEKGDFK